MSIEIPLFPLKTVLFPGGPLRLRIFEPRYLDMVARCARADNRFGVVAIRSGGEVGDAEMFGLLRDERAPAARAPGGRAR